MRLQQISFQSHILFHSNIQNVHFEAVIMALIVSEFMVKFMLITIHKLSIGSGISRSLSIAISFSIVISRMSIFEAVIMALIVSEFMVKFMLITIYKLSIGSGFSRSLSIAISFSIVIS